MAEKKITKRENFEGIMNFLAENGKSEWAKVMEHEIELLARKNSKSAKLTPAQEDKVAIGEIVKDILSECENPIGMTVGAILLDERISSYKRHDGKVVNSQIITNILTDWLPPDEKYPNRTNEVIRTVEKKAPHYRLNYGVEGEGEGE